MPSLVVMGVSGCGKSHLAARLATGLGLSLIEGDDFHGEANRARMKAGLALTDEHRAAWLQRLGAELIARPDGAVLTCSALKRAYRETLRRAVPGLRFAWLDLSAEQARLRVAGRADHFFPAELVDAQFRDLEPPLGEPLTLRLEASEPADALAAQVSSWLRHQPP